MNDESIFVGGFEDAVLGLTEDNRIVYSREIMVNILESFLDINDFEIILMDPMTILNEIWGDADELSGPIFIGNDFDNDSDLKYRKMNYKEIITELK